jgi:hypothetical protein
MDAGRRWNDLSERTRRLIVVGGVLEGIVKIAALADLRRRPAADIRGPKWLWAVVLVVANSVGLVPLAYFRLGRRHP